MTVFSAYFVNYNNARLEICINYIIVQTYFLQCLVLFLPPGCVSEGILFLAVHPAYSFVQADIVTTVPREWLEQSR